MSQFSPPGAAAATIVSRDDAAWRTPPPARAPHANGGVVSSTPSHQGVETQLASKRIVPTSEADTEQLIFNGAMASDLTGDDNEAAAAISNAPRKALKPDLHGARAGQIGHDAAEKQHRPRRNRGGVNQRRPPGSTYRPVQAGGSWTYTPPPRTIPLPLAVPPPGWQPQEASPPYPPLPPVSLSAPPPPGARHKMYIRYTHGVDPFRADGGPHPPGAPRPPPCPGAPRPPPPPGASRPPPQPPGAPRQPPAPVAPRPPPAPGASRPPPAPGASRPPPEPGAPRPPPPPGAPRPPPPS